MRKGTLVQFEVLGLLLTMILRVVQLALSLRFQSANSAFHTPLFLMALHRSLFLMLTFALVQPRSALEI